MAVYLKNDVNSIHSLHDGVYELSKTINEENSWTKNDSVIQYKPESNSWRIGTSNEDSEVINSDTDFGSGYCPYDVPLNEWSYHDGGWKRPSIAKDIRVQCLKGKL